MTGNGTRTHVVFELDKRGLVGVGRLVRYCSVGISCGGDWCDRRRVVRLPNCCGLDAVDVTGLNCRTQPCLHVIETVVTEVLGAIVTNVDTLSVAAQAMVALVLAQADL